jgi:hypothetical protein
MASEAMAVKAAKAKVDFEIEREERVMVGPLFAPKWLIRVC